MFVPSKSEDFEVSCKFVFDGPLTMQEAVRNGGADFDGAGAPLEPDRAKHEEGLWIGVMGRICQCWRRSHVD